MGRVAVHPRQVAARLHAGSEAVVATVDGGHVALAGRKYVGIVDEFFSHVGAGHDSGARIGADDEALRVAETGGDRIWREGERSEARLEGGKASGRGGLVWEAKIIRISQADGKSDAEEEEESFAACSSVVGVYRKTSSKVPGHGLDVGEVH